MVQKVTQMLQQEGSGPLVNLIMLQMQKLSVELKQRLAAAEGIGQNKSPAVLHRLPCSILVLPIAAYQRNLVQV